MSTEVGSLLGSVLVAFGPRLRDELCAHLDGAGYEVRRARDLDQSLAALRGGPCDAVLCDLSADGPGPGFFREVRGVWDDVPVIVSAAAGRHGDVIAALREGAFGYVEEPFAPPDVVLLVGRAVTHRRLVARHYATEARWHRLETAVRRMNEAGGRDDLLAVLRRELPPLLDVEHCAVYECDEGSLTLAVATRDRAAPAIAIEGDRPVLVPGASGADPSSLLVPAFVQYQPVAVLAVDRRVAAPPSDLDVQFYQAVAAHVGSALRVRQHTEALEHTLTDLREAQADLLRAERVAVVGKLAFDVSHELKNRLTSMTFAVQNVRDAAALAGPARAAVEASVELLGEDIRRMRERVEAFYAMARHRDLRDQLCRVDTVVEQLLERFQHDPRQVALSCHAEPATARVDQEQLYSAVANLVLNAFEALAQTAGAEVHVSVSAHDQRVRIAVEDNGPGVPPEIRGKVFDAFYGTKPKGTGLGLSQVFVFAELSGGRAYLADSPAGARFVIELPEAAQ